MDETENTFDSVRWEREHGEDTTSPTAPYSRSNGKQRQSAHYQPPDPNADEQDLAGIGASGYLDSRVDSPQRENEGTQNAFVSYLITTESDFKTFSKTSFSVRRRFTDFVYLYKYLFRAYPHIAVPPLPDKHTMSYVRGDRFGSDFTHRRAFSLHRFTRRIALHPVLRRNPTFLMFLETNDWNALMKGRGASSTSMSESGAPSSVGASTTLPVGGNISSTSAFDSFQDWSMNLFSRPHKPDQRFVSVKEKSDKLDEDLSHVEKIAIRVTRREGDLENDYMDLATQFRKLVSMEPGIGAELTSFASSVDETGQGMKVLRESMERDYLGSLRDMSAYVGSLKSLLKVREQKQLDFEALSEYRAKSASDRDTLANQHGTPSITSAPSSFIRAKIEDVRGVDHESSRRNRLRAKEMEIERLTREVEEAKKTSEAFDDAVVGECGEFERIKRDEMKETMGSLCQSEMAFWRGTIDTWEEFLGGLEKGELKKAEP